jgi:uncharacterized MnhB-related membrane protein
MWAILTSRTILVALIGVLFTILRAANVLPEALTEDMVVNAIYGVVLVLVVFFRKNATVDLSGK